MGTLRQTIALLDARFHAFHGFYPEEQLTGHTFWVNIKVCWHPESVKLEVLEHTLNYEQLYHIAQVHMQETKKLLETVAQGILHQLQNDFTYLEEIEVSIRKQHPPFGGDISQTMVQYLWKK